MDLSDGKRMFGDIKSKLGFKGKTDAGAYDEYYDDDYDDYGEGYDDYADDGYGSSYDGGGSSSRYDSYGGSVTTRRSGTRSASSSSRSSSSSLPRLVSIDDVRANTQVPSSLSRDPLPPRHVTRASGSSSYRSTRTMVDSSLPPEMTPEGTAATAAAASRRHSDGLESLFTPTTEEPARTTVDSGLHARTSATTSTARSSYDPYDALSGSTGSSYSSKRSVVVLRPADYGEAEQVAKALKAGDVAVLCLGATPDALAKRILDFSFGVAAALDANVECVADKTFAITRFKELSDSERVGLHAQGVL